MTPDRSYTEAGMNGGVSESELPETFERDDYRVLLVAEKDRIDHRRMRGAFQTTQWIKGDLISPHVFISN